MEYRNLVIGNIRYIVQEAALDRLFIDIVLVRHDDLHTKVHAPYLPVDAIVEKPLEAMIDIINDSRYELFVNLLIGHGAILEDILSCFTNKY